MTKKVGRPPTEINWPLLEQLVKFHAPINYVARQIKVDEKRLCREIKRIYNETWPEFAKRLKNESCTFLVGKMWQKAIQGSEKWMMYMGKYYCGHNEHELERQVKDKYESKDSEVKISVMQQLFESSQEMLRIHGSVAEPRILDEKDSEDE